MASLTRLSRSFGQAVIGRLIGAALVALLLAQSAALTHAVAHTPRGASAVLAEREDGPSGPWGPSGRWDHDAGTPTCTLIDHLLLGTSTGGDSPAVAGLPPEASVASVSKQRRLCAGSRQPYEARGPPWA